MKAVKKLQNLHVKIHGEVKRKEMTDLNFRYKDGLVKKLWPITSTNPIFIIYNSKGAVIIMKHSLKVLRMNAGVNKYLLIYIRHYSLA